MSQSSSRRSHGGISHLGSAGTIGTVVAAKNILNQGFIQHFRLQNEDANAYFLIQNKYRTYGSTNNINPFLDPAAAPVHFMH